MFFGLNKEDIKMFLISSSYPVILISYMYLVSAYIRNVKKTNNDVHIEKILFFIPLLFGIVGIINNKIIKKYNNKNISILIGLIFGLLLSFMGRFGLNLPKLMFGYKNEKNIWVIHIIAMFLYAFIFRLILTPIQNLFL